MSSQFSLIVEAVLRKANLCRDNLGGSSQLQGANFTGADLRGANLSGAEYDRSTVFPLSISGSRGQR